MKYLANCLLMGLLLASNCFAADKKIVFIAGPPSHGPGEHEFRAGCLLLQSCLKNVPGVTSVVYTNGWPNEPDAFANAATIILYSDGGAGHPFLKTNRLQEIAALMKQGVGLGCIHYAVEPTKDQGERELIEWTGGAFEINWSVNPHWVADFQKMPNHPVTEGVQPFKINDEWYFNMRFRENMKGVTPILSAVPTPGTTNRNDGPHEGNATVRGQVERGELQTVAWVCERADGGRGFGFTGAHTHKNWGDENFRKLVLNAILWTAKAPIPGGGVKSTLAPGQLEENLDVKGKR